MRTLRTVEALRTALRPARRAGRTVGLVPTMGALHEGHLSLVRRARSECDVVVVSLFVNPAQFNDAADLAAYPRDADADAAAAAAAGADLLYAPPVEVVYPPGFATAVQVRGVLTETLEGAHRGTGHFDGVTTVVTKLLISCEPDVAYFGQKDAQQVAVVRRLVRDLDLPVRIAVSPTVREPDGLALSSRNVHLRGAERARAVALHEGLNAAAAAVRRGVRAAATVREAALKAMAERDVHPEYVEVVDPDTFEPVATLTGPALLAVAARVGPTRLIDNAVLEPPALGVPGEDRR